MNYRKIAGLAGVSPSTVSKALAGSTEISPDLVEKIQKIAIEQGYFKEKNRRKREYSGNGSINIAFIAPELYSAHYTSNVNRIKSEVESRGGNIAVYISDFDDKKADDILRSLIMGGVTDGVIMYCKSPNFSSPDFPIIAIDEYREVDYDVLCYGVSELIYASLKYLRDMGHTKIGFIGDALTKSKAKNFRLGLKAFGLPFDENFFISSDEKPFKSGKFEDLRNRPFRAGILAARRIAELEERPSAVLCAYDEIAMSLICELKKLGIRVPEDISVMGINNVPTAAYAAVPLTTIEEDQEGGYAAAVELLFDKIINETKEVKTVSMSYRIVERESVKKIN